ncbi:Oidioi.mRNA.OKI2018_I69.chr2.g8126.t1.cds [Oikopleura dioica]|uniref:ribose-phosphate diphosphokinase n=1 Tax=Oikopleura dioica TaxID=34765 RepID=A0ABN7T8V0_OIKDI|nr:Oidioi.mRNA.OKI2018_I69.chr2.g8126.t1.cds [Oikopleura dioica]
MKEIKVFAGSSHPALVGRICERLGINPAKAKTTKFKNKETNVEIQESVRGCDCYIVQTSNEKVNDLVMETLIMTSACVTASANRVFVVLPCFPYSRLDQRGAERKAIGGKLIANLLTTAGATAIITMDLHSEQTEGFFDIPVDNLLARPLIVQWLKQHYKNPESCVIVSPDAGGVKRVTAIADRFKTGFAIFHRDQRKEATSTRHAVIGDVKGKACIIVDDLADTCETLLTAARALKNCEAASVIAIVTHGLFSFDSIERIEKSAIDKLIVTNTLPQAENLTKSSKLEIIDISQLLTEAIRRTHNSESVRALFDTVPGIWN